MLLLLVVSMVLDAGGVDVDVDAVGYCWWCLLCGIGVCIDIDVGWLLLVVADVLCHAP